MRYGLLVASLVGCAAPVEQEIDTEPVRVEQAPAKPRLSGFVPSPEPLPSLRYYVSVTNAAPVLSAVAAWAKVTDAVRSWERVTDYDDADILVLEVGPHSGMCRDTAAACVHSLESAWTRHENPERSPQTVYVVAGRYERAPELFVMHELGHALGLTHSEEPGQLMLEAFTDAELARDWDCPDAFTVARLAEETGAEGLVGCEVP